MPDQSLPPESETESSTEEEFTPETPPPAEEEGVAEAPAFMGLFTVIMLLLMVFFIVLVAQGSSNATKFEYGKKSIESNANVLGLGGSKQVLYFVYSVMKIQSSAVKDALEMKQGATYSSGASKKDRKSKDEGNVDKKQNMFEGVSHTAAQQMQRYVSLGLDFSVTKNEDTKLHSMNIKIPLSRVFLDNTATLEQTYAETLRSFFKMSDPEFVSLTIYVYSSQVPKNIMGITTAQELAALRAYRLCSVAQAIFGAQSQDRVNALGFINTETNADGSINTNEDLAVIKIVQNMTDEKTPPVST